ncbi:hypothetical protein Slin15195_G094860 [Septoria linicola]|uniref:PAN domain-containing protein n=1 Tax=Septoria linicola TaxID=215465 RepID=A0A9Q9AUM5_9PEZI|nr:hypothetical protein Slin15195_G094860 [Septoria linicola]
MAALLASGAAALVIPRVDAPTVGGSDLAINSDSADAIAAYEQVADEIPQAVAAPIGTGSQSLPEDSDAVSDAAAEDATHGGLTKRDEIFKRGTCKPQPSKFFGGPNVANLTRAGWEAQTYWKDTAMLARTPARFFQVKNWRALKASAEASPLRGFTSDLTSYDPAVCAQKCEAINGCVSFVIYFERNPTINLDGPSSRNECPVALAAQTLVKCAFYGIGVTASQATNVGQFTGGPQPNERPATSAFYTSIAGSNAYTLTPQTPDGFTEEFFGVGTIKAPENTTTYMGIQTFPGASFNPQACADACNAKSDYNQRQAARNGQSEFRQCRFFNAYVSLRNGTDPLFTCTYYTEPYDASFATNIQQRRNGALYTHDSSYGYTLEQLR